MSKQNTLGCYRVWAIVTFVALTLGYFYSFWFTISDNNERKDSVVYDLQKERCHDFSPAFPSAGGPGCKIKCEPKDSQPTSTYAVIYLNKTHSWPKELLDNMHLAAGILKKYGTPRSLDTERPVYLHVAFDYYCCYTEYEAVKIGGFINSHRWTSQTISFNKMVCAISSHGDIASLVLMVDDESQKKLLRYALENEEELERKTGIPKNIPHTQLQDFHMTLATVDQREFPVQAALKEINNVIQPGKWHRTPVVLNRPVCRKCDRLISALKKEN